MADEAVLILGGRGMLGSDLARTCQRRGLAAEVLDLPDFDITDKEKLPRALENYPVIVNCAAYTNVEKPKAKPNLPLVSTHGPSAASAKRPKKPAPGYFTSVPILSSMVKVKGLTLKPTRQIR